MVRAATTGGFDYRGADPYNKQWRLKHSLILQDVHRLAEAQICQAAHDHWLAYASHSNLEADSWSKVKKHATKALNTLQAAVLPWRPESEKEGSEDTIEGKYGDLIRQYQEMVARKAAEKDAKKAAENS
jgi:hypothetical protein